MKWRLPVYGLIWVVSVVMLVRAWRQDRSPRPIDPVSTGAVGELETRPADSVVSQRHRPMGRRVVEQMVVRREPAPAWEAPSDAGLEQDPAILDGEYVIRFHDAHEARAFIALAEAQGATILGRIPALNLLRVRVRDAAQWRRLLEAGPPGVVETPNHVAWNPERREPPEPPPHIVYRPFLADAPTWLGLASTRLPGRPVTVALLDDGLAAHWALGDATWRVIDLLDAGTREGGRHGLAMASLIVGASETVPGLAAGADLLSYRVLDADGVGNAFTLAEAIIAAVDAGAAVINCSLGTYGDNLALREAVRYAHARGVPIVAAVGNDGYDGMLMYPAGYPSVIAVAAVDADGRHAWFSNRGPGIDVAAPGYQLNAAWTDGQVGRISGTSPAAAVVSAAVARLLSSDPALSPDAIRDVLRSTSDDFGAPGVDPALGAGIINLERMERRDQRGIYEISARPPYAYIDERTPDRYTGVFFAQNSGTERLGQVDMTVEVERQSKHGTFRDVGPGDHGIITIDLGPVDQGPRELEIRMEATIRNAPGSPPVGRLGGLLRLD